MTLYLHQLIEHIIVNYALYDIQQMLPHTLTNSIVTG